MNKCIILANGKPPKKSIISFFKNRGFDILICADGGADSSLKMNLVPSVIIGDFDSISTESLREFKSVSKIIKIKRQNDTDVEKCLKYAVKKGFDEAVLMGVTGNRLDHTFCNLGIVLKFFPKIKISTVAENSYLQPYNGNIKLKTFRGETISIYGFDKKTRIVSKGFKYELENISLPFGERESTSNVSTSSTIHLQIKNGVVFVIRDFNSMKKYGLFQFD